MHDETVETYTNVYARWFAIISQFIVTASLCTLWRLQMTRYSQVLVHSTVVNSQLSHQYMSISLIFLSCFGIYSDFSYFLPGLFRLLGWVWGAVLVISAVSATFCEVSGIMVEAQHHKLTTTYLKKHLCPLISRTQL